MSATPARRCLAIVNPQGGTRRGLAILNRVRPVFVRAGIDLAAHVTKHPGHARQIAATATLDAFDSLCVIGGDGTIHEIVNGLMQRPRPVSIPLGFIPAGSGNTLTQQLRCLDPIEAATRIIAGRTCPLDAMKLKIGHQTLYCVDLIGWGALADVNRTANSLRFLGQSRYAAAALWHILRAHPRRARVTLDNTTIEDDFLFVVACNTRFVASGMNVAPRADIGDGKIDLVLVRRASRPQMVKMFSKVFDGSYISMPCVEYRQVRSFSIESDYRAPLDIDGEIAGHAPFHAEVLPSAFRVFA